MSSLTTLYVLYRFMSSHPSILPALCIFVYKIHRAHQNLHSFPTRRSSDLIEGMAALSVELLVEQLEGRSVPEVSELSVDRKSTRLNSSHLGISYAVFCLKKKKKKYGDEEVIHD